MEGLDKGRDQTGLRHAYVGAVVQGVDRSPYVLQFKRSTAMYALVHKDWRLHGGLWLLLPVRSARYIRQTDTPDEGGVIQPILYRQLSHILHYLRSI